MVWFPSGFGFSVALTALALDQPDSDGMQHSSWIEIHCQLCLPTLHVHLALAVAVWVCVYHLLDVAALPWALPVMLFQSFGGIL
tara:strand:+ start:371 stop:622 length:252 start_codon:yes stop_codon:yes gene_type:complete